MTAVRVAVLLGLVACSGKTTGDTGSTGVTTNPVTGATEDVIAFPTHVYTGLDEEGGYSSPVLATGGNGTFTWTTTTPTVVSVTGSDLGVVTALGAGTGSVTATSGAKTATVPVDVTAYTVVQRNAGQAAYEANDCDKCHGTANPDITPSGIGEHTEAEVLTAITADTNPEGGTIGAHSFSMTGDANPGIVAYLRSLPAAGEPAVDE